jgi:hypothetical protein
MTTGTETTNDERIKQIKKRDERMNQRKKRTWVEKRSGPIDYNAPGAHHICECGHKRFFHEDDCGCIRYFEFGERGKGEGEGEGYCFCMNFVPVIED